MIANKTPRQIGFALVSIVLGMWTFKKTTEISGPAFEPIIAACTNPEYANNMDEFVAQTGYHAYEPLVGLKVFNFLVCLITQFLLELRQTYPGGILTWGGVVLSAMAAGTWMTAEAGRAGAGGMLRYPIIVGLLYQLFGISVMFPLVWVPSYILARGSGPITKYRAAMAIPLNLPGMIMTAAVFIFPTDSYLWMLSAGTMGGPLLAMFPVFLWIEGTPPTNTKENAAASSLYVISAFKIMCFLGTIGYFVAVYIAYDAYFEGSFIGMMRILWGDVWVNANASVAFMTIDTLILHVAVILCIAYRSIPQAIKTTVLTPIMGPAAACWVLAEMEATRYDEETKEKQT